MIRVLLRHIDDADGRLLGDYLPSEIDGLIERLMQGRIYWDDESDDCSLCDDPCQWVSTEEARPRMVLEVLIEG